MQRQELKELAKAIQLANASIIAEMIDWEVGMSDEEKVNQVFEEVKTRIGLRLIDDYEKFYKEASI